MEPKISQSYQMQSELMQLLKSIVVMTMFSWMGYYSFLGERPAFLWPILGCIFFLFASVLTRKLDRAYIFYLLMYILGLVNALLLFDSSLHLIFAGGLLADLSFGWLILIGAVVTIIGFWSQFQLKRFQLKASFDHNIKSGRLNIKRGYWNFDMPLHFDSPKLENKRMQRLNRLSQLSPIVTALGFALARAIDGGLQIVGYGVCLYIFGCVVAWGSVKYLVIVFQLREWENMHKVEIKV